MVSNQVGQSWQYVLGPTNLASGQTLLFSGSFPTNGLVVPTNTLHVWGTDPLFLTISDSTAPKVLPQVWLVAPGAVFTAPTNITLTATSTAPAETVVKVEYFAGSNFIGRALANPFAVTWSNAAPGTNILTAVLTDTNCETPVSAPVQIIVRDPPAALYFEQVAWPVSEGAGVVALRVRRNFWGATNVVFFTSASGSEAPANEISDYLGTNGVLSFQGTEVTKTIEIPIINDALVEGNETFKVTLVQTNSGGQPTEALVTIVDNDSLLQAVAPTQVDTNELGRLRIYLTNDGGVGAWRPLGQRWLSSGEVLGGLAPGEYEVEFKPGALWSSQAPLSVRLSVLPRQETRSTNSYTLTPQPLGSLTVFIDPPSVATNSNLPCRGQWQREGEGGVWHDSGHTLSGLPPDNYVIRFRALANGCGWATPGNAVSLINGSAGTVQGTYSPPPPPGSAITPQPLDFDQLTNSHNAHVGKIVTGFGEASGFTVKERVVLTAAHAVFDDNNLMWASPDSVVWLFQQHAPRYHPAGQSPRGIVRLDGYATQRQIERASGGIPGVSSPASFDLDVAALYFYELAGRSGYSGYLVSESTNQWLMSNAPAVLAGYPVQGISEEDQGKLHATTPQPIAFALRVGSVFESYQLAARPGHSGGPLSVLHPNGDYYPAGIYLGSGQGGQAMVRAIDTRTIDLISQADAAAAPGTNEGSGGVVRFGVAVPSGLCANFATVSLLPAAAVTAGARWRVHETSPNRWLPWTNSSTFPIVVNNKPDFLELTAIEGFLTPNPGVLNLQCLSSNTNAELRLTYVQLLPRLQALPPDLVLFGVTNRTYRVERNNSVGSTNWTPFMTVAFPPTSGTSRIPNAFVPVGSNRFYRAVRVP
jgi:hypothetical protein